MSDNLLYSWGYNDQGHLAFRKHPLVKVDTVKENECYTFGCFRCKFQRGTVVQKTNGTSLIYRCKMALF